MRTLSLMDGKLGGGNQPCSMAAHHMSSMVQQSHAAYVPVRRTLLGHAQLPRGRLAICQSLPLGTPRSTTAKACSSWNMAPYPNVTVTLAPDLTCPQP